MTPGSAEPTQLTLDDREVPISRTVPKDSDSRMVRRPKPGEAWDDADSSFMLKLAKVLDHAGVQPGDAFYVSRVPPRPLQLAPAVRSGDPATSKAASAWTPTRSSQATRILQSLVMAGSCTAREIARRTLIPYCSVTPRIGQLKRAGYIEPTGDAAREDMGADNMLIRATAKGRDLVVSFHAT